MSIRVAPSTFVLMAPCFISLYSSYQISKVLPRLEYIVTKGPFILSPTITAEAPLAIIFLTLSTNPHFPPRSTNAAHGSFWTLVFKEEMKTTGRQAVRASEGSSVSTAIRRKVDGEGEEGSEVSSGRGPNAAALAMYVSFVFCLRWESVG